MNRSRFRTFSLFIALLVVNLSGMGGAITPVQAAPPQQALEDFSILLGRPTDHSITANVIPAESGFISFEYGTESGVYGTQTSAVSCTADAPVEVEIDGLTVDTRYYYRLLYGTASTGPWMAGDEASFRTQRLAGDTFTFTIASDSHLGQYGGQTADERALYEQTLLNVGADQPDFHIDLGDTSAMDPSPLGTGMTEAEAEAAYLVQRPPMDLISNRIPIFLAIGNHENEEGWNFDDAFTPPDQSLARVGLRARKMYFPNPVPDGFYSGNEDPLPEAIGGDTYREDYYAWTWGDALFVVIDPYHYSMTWPGEGGTYGGEGQDGEASGDRWDWSLGIEQYLWLKHTLENSDATYKFVFSHHVTGGSTPYGRGGTGAAPYFEWGGYNIDGTWGWDTERPASEGWDVPIHQLMVENGVDVYFHGHDHMYAMEELDGIVYLECPKPDDAGYTWEPYSYGYTEGLYPDGYVLQNSGHIRVTVSPAEATIEYVRAYLPGDGTNGVVAHSTTIPAVPAAHNLTTAVDPAGGGTTSPAAGIHSYKEGAHVTVRATPSTSYAFDHWDGACTGTGDCQVTMDGDKTVTAHFNEIPPSAIAYVGNIGAAAVKSSGNRLVVNTTAAVTAGDDIIIVYATDPNQNIPPITVTDAAGNTYSQAAYAVNTGNLRTYIFAASNVNALSAGSAITITASASVTARAAVVSVFRGLADSGALDQTGTGTGSSATPSSGTTSATTQADELLIGAVGTEGPNGDAAGTWGNSFMAGPRLGTSGDAADSNITASLGWRIVSTTGAYAAQKSGITSRDWAAAIATFRAAAAPTTYNLTLAVDPAGSGTTNPAAGVHSYAEGTVVTITATSAPGYTFDHWSGACAGTGTCQVAMDSSKVVTATFTEVVSPADLTGTVTLQRQQPAPHASWSVPLRVELYVVGQSTPLYSFTPTTDNSGQFTLTDIAPDTYRIAVKHSHTLQVVDTVTLAAGNNSHAFGTLLEGDANDDNYVALPDFSILSAAYNTVQGSAGYNAAADFNNNGTIDLLDFSLLSANYNQAGEQP
jgi:hypothetical protein